MTRSELGLNSNRVWALTAVARGQWTSRKPSKRNLRNRALKRLVEMGAVEIYPQSEESVYHITENGRRMLALVKLVDRA